jgi:hypothetical protein
MRMRMGTEEQGICELTIKSLIVSICFPPTLIVC